MSTTPAFSPMPTRSFSRIASVVVSPNRRRCTLLDLYEQCSLHMTLYMASSDDVGRRPRMSRIRAYSSSFSPSSAYGWGVSGEAVARSTVSRRAGAVDGVCTLVTVAGPQERRGGSVPNLPGARRPQAVADAHGLARYSGRPTVSM